MTTRFPVIATLLISLIAAQSPIASGEELSYKFEQGEEYGYLIEQKMDMLANGLNMEMLQKLLVTTKIESVADNGTAEAAQTIERVQMRMMLPGQTMEYDTNSEEEPDNPALQQVANNLGKMVGEAIGMKISPTGEMSDIQIPEKIRSSQQGPGAGGADQVEQMFRQSGLKLPAGEISPGHSWDQDMELNLPFGTMEITTTYTYQGKNDDGLDKIDATMDLNLKQEENPQIKMSLTAKDAKGSFLFDNKAGRVVRSEVNQQLEIDLGGVAKQDITTTVTMTLTDDDSVAKSFGEK